MNTLKEKLFSLSKSLTWDEAVKEWKLSHIKYVKEPDTCACGHYPIKEICTLLNIKTDNFLEVGNHCVKHFLKSDYSYLFDSFKSLSKSPTKSVNEKTLSWFLSQTLINEWEYSFYSDILRKRNLSQKQMIYKLKINLKILKFFIRSRKNKNEEDIDKLIEKF